MSSDSVSAHPLKALPLLTTIGPTGPAFLHIDVGHQALSGGRVQSIALQAGTESFLAVRGKDCTFPPMAAATDRYLTTVFALMTMARVIYNVQRMGNNVVKFNCVWAGLYDVKKGGEGRPYVCSSGSDISTDDFG